MSAQSAKPTYVGIGAQKCASTWLHRILAEHPQVAVPEAKEIDFFSYRYDRGYHWYERHFGDGGAALARGEISPSYFCEPAVPERVACYLPGARILLSLRDPVERALSNHRHEVREGHVVESDFSFETGLRNNPMYVEQGRYATHLKNWLRSFPIENIMVILMEDVEADPHAVSRSVYEFLGVDDRFVPAGLKSRFNRSFATRWSALGRAKDVAYRSSKQLGMQRVWEAAAGSGLRSVYRRVNTVPSGAVIPAPREETLRELRALFEPEVQELERLIGRSLTSWLRH